MSPAAPVGTAGWPFLRLFPTPRGTRGGCSVAVHSVKRSRPRALTAVHLSWGVRRLHRPQLWELARVRASYEYGSVTSVLSITTPAMRAVVNAALVVAVALPVTLSGAQGGRVACFGDLGTKQYFGSAEQVRELQQRIGATTPRACPKSGSGSPPGHGSRPCCTTGPRAQSSA